MLKRLHAHHVSFRHAWDGFVHTTKTQPNFRFHLMSMIGVAVLGIYYGISLIEWLVLIFTINLVLVAEMINTAMEAIVDLITLEYRQDAKVAKDVSAGMVLVSAFFAVVIGLLIFLPKIINSL